MRRESRRTRNNMIIGALCVVLMIMAAAYALGNTQLNIDTTTNISSTWNILISKITPNAVGDAYDENYTYAGLNASFDAHFTFPGDSITYEIEVTNNGNVNATLTDIKKKITNESEYITIESSGFSKGDTINKGETKKLYLTASFIEDVPLGNFTETIESQFSIDLDFAQEGSKVAPDRPDVEYEVTYDCETNGGTECLQYNEMVGAGYAADLTKIATKEGYEFVGWNTDWDSNEALEEVTVEEETTLYAIYKKDIVINYTKDEEIEAIEKVKDTYTIYNKDSYEVTLPSITSADDSNIVAWYEDTKAVGVPGKKRKFTTDATLIAKIAPKPIMKSYSDDSENSELDFHGEDVNTKINFIKIVDLSDVDAPEIDNIKSWDASAEENESVIAWLSGITLNIGGLGGVIAPEDSSKLFYSNTHALSFVRNIDLQLLDTSNVTNMSNMFGNIQKLSELKINSLDTLKVTDMSFMFNGCKNITNLDLRAFNTTKVTNMSSMFAGCEKLSELDLHGFNTSKVTDMEGMFIECLSLNTIYASANFITTSVGNSNSMFENCTNLVGGNGTSYEDAGIIDSEYARIDTEETPGYFTDSNESVLKKISTTVGPNSITAILSINNRDNEITKYEYSLDGEDYKVGESNTYTFTKLKQGTSYTVYVKVTTENNTYTKQTSAQTTYLQLPTYSEKKIENGKRVTIIYLEECGKTLTCTYSKDGGKDIKVTAPTRKVDFIAGGSIVAKISDGINEVSSSYKIIMKSMMKSWNYNDKTDFHSDDYKKLITSIEFVDLNKVEVPDIDEETSWDVSADGDESVIAWVDGTNLYIGGDGEVLANINSSYLFYEFENVTNIDLGLLNTSCVANMSQMFAWCSNLTSLDLSNFDTSNVTSMNGMFYLCSNFDELDLSNFDTSKVTDMNGMFQGVHVSSLNISGFDTSSVTDMSSMFAEFSSSNYLDLSNFNTSNVTDMSSMFSWCFLDMLDLSSFDTHKVTNMSNMFYNCENLRTIYVSEKFVTDNVTQSASMFEYCEVLVGENGTINDSSYTDKTYARIDTEDTPGYFSDSSKMMIRSIATTATTSKITAIVTVFDKGKEIVKYEFSLDGDEYEESTGENKNIYTFTGLESDNYYTVYVRVTDSDGNTYDRTTGKNTEMLESPYMGERNIENGKKITITYPTILKNEEQINICDEEDYTCTYIKDNGEEVTVDSSTEGTDLDDEGALTIGIPFTSAGTLVAIVSDGTNEVSRSYTVIMKPLMKVFKKYNSDFYNYKDAITSIEIVDFNNTGLTVPEVDGITSFDISARSDRTVIAWVENGTKLYIGGENGVLANSTSTNLFSSFSNLQTADLSLLDTTNVTNMNNMFAYCNNLTSLDLGDFNIQKVTNMTGMFQGCSKLTTIYVSDAFVPNKRKARSTSMFAGCTSLVGGNSTVYNASYTDGTYARIDKAGEPGYFTLKTS